MNAAPPQPPSGGGLLAVFAHPDDESFGPAGTLARYAAEGRPVHLLTLTDGALGDLPPEVADSGQSLAEVRARELECAAKVLGVTALHHFCYRDSGMPGSPHNHRPDCLLQADSREVVARIAEIMVRWKPQVVITHDPTGGYFHPDHIRASELTAAAFQAAQGPRRLYYTVLSRSFIRWAILFLRLSGRDPTRFGRNGDVDLTALGTPDRLIDVQVDVGPYLDVKRRAMACHRSQGGGEQAPPLGLPRWLQDRLSGAERFVQGLPPPASGGRPDEDLFHGL